MKKHLILFLTLMLLLCTGCAKEAAQERPATVTRPANAPLLPSATEAIPFAPEIAYDTAKANNVPAVLSILDRGDTVSLVGNYDTTHYVVKTQQGYGLVEKNLLRPEGYADYEAWTGYAYDDAELYEDLHFTGKPLLTLSQNTKIEVLDDLGYCYVVRTMDVYGFMMKDGVSKWYFSASHHNDVSEPAQGSVVLLSAIAQEGEVTGEATVLADGTPVILGYFNRGDQIPVVAGPQLVESWKGYVTVYMDGLYAHVPQMLVANDGDAAYDTWKGYSRWDGAVYDNYHCLGESIQKLHLNAQVLVIEELEECYIVDISGHIGYVPKEMISRTWISSGDNSDSSDSGSSDSGSSDSGSSGSGGSSDSGEWTPPMM